MKPLAFLLGVALISRLAGTLGLRGAGSWRSATRIGVSMMLLMTGATHFVGLRDDLIRMVPPYIPMPGLVVTLTGIAEICGGLGLLVPAVRTYAAWGIIALLVAVTPANVYASMQGLELGGEPVTPLAIRLPIQALLIFLTAWSGLHRGVLPRGASVPASVGSDERRRV